MLIKLFAGIRTTLNWQTKLPMRGRGELLIFVGFAFSFISFSHPSCCLVIGSIPHSNYQRQKLDMVSEFKDDNPIKDLLKALQYVYFVQY